MLNAVSLQPYYGGSHRAFIDHWVEHSVHNWKTISLPDRHWKWRMRHASVYFAREIKQCLDAGQPIDVIFCTDMMGVAELRGLLPVELRRVPVVVYYHENQFCYPNRISKERDQHFAFTNFTSALAADACWFNSRFNLDSMVDGLNEQARRWPDFVPKMEIESLIPKSKIQHPGIMPPPFDVNQSIDVRIKRLRDGPIHLLWAARWEHDKNPGLLLDALIRLQDQGIEFSLSIIGPVFREVPSAFDSIKSRFFDRIIEWGYLPDKADYWNAMQRADLFISTADHEFFGIAAAEALACGLVPLLPDRLAYPELLACAALPAGSNYLYDGTATGMASRLRLALGSMNEETSDLLKQMSGNITRRLGWDVRAPELDRELDVIVLKSKES